MTAVAIRRSDVPTSFSAQMQMAAALADSTLLPGYLRNRPANVLLVLMGALTLDISAFQALQSIHVVDGKLGMPADLMRALMIRAGHQVSVIERTALKARIKVQRSDKAEPYYAEFTYEDAVAAGLHKKENYTKYLKAMLVARATSIAFRDECPDVAFGISYTPDELGAAVNEDGTVRVDNEGKIVLQGEVVEPPTQEMVDSWFDIITGGDLTTAVPQAWEHVLSRKAADAESSDYVGTLSNVLAVRLLSEAAYCETVEDVRQLWKFALLLSALDYRTTQDEIVRTELTGRSEAIKAAAKAREEQDKAAELIPPTPTAEMLGEVYGMVDAVNSVIFPDESPAPPEDKPIDRDDPRFQAHMGTWDQELRIATMDERLGAALEGEL